MLFNGANINEKMDVSANGGRIRFTRDARSIVMDLNDVERIDATGLGGVDNLTVNDVTGTDLTQVNPEPVRLRRRSTTGRPTRWTLNATLGADVVSAAGDNTGVSALGLAARRQRDRRRRGHRPPGGQHARRR